jgi:hypothetical protein
MARKILYFSLLVFAFSFCIIGSAQQAPVRDTIITDTVGKEVLAPLRKRVTDEIRSNIAQLKADKITAKQNAVLKSIMKVAENANDYLKRGIDTAGISSQVDYVLALYDVAGDGVFTSIGSTQTERNLATSSTLLKELLNRQKLRKRHWIPTIETWWDSRTTLTRLPVTAFLLSCLQIL